MLNLSFSTLCLDSHKRVPAPWSYKPLTSTCRASALSLLGMTFHPFGTLAASRKGRPALSLACEYVCLCTGAQLKTLIVCRLLLSSKVYESKNWRTESESKQALFLSTQSHLHIFALSTQFKEFCSAAMYSPAVLFIITGTSQNAHQLSQHC